MSVAQTSKYSEVFDFNEDGTDAQFNLENLKKYVKFHVRIKRSGADVEKLILRSDLVKCKREFFKGLTVDEHDDEYFLDYNIGRRLCPDMDMIKDYLQVKNTYNNKHEKISFSIQAVNCDQE